MIFLWIKLSKNVIFSDKDLYVCLCYVTPDDSSRQSMVETNIFDRMLDSVVHIDRPAKSPDLGRRLSAFSLHCRLTGFEVHFTGEIENLLAFFFSDRLFYYLR